MAKTVENMGFFESVALMVFSVGGFALSLWYMVLIWGWFMVPLGLPALGAAHLFGLTCVKGMLFANWNNMWLFDEMKKEYKKGPWHDLVFAVVAKSLLLLMAYIATLFL